MKTVHLIRRALLVSILSVIALPCVAGSGTDYKELDTILRYVQETRNSGFNEMYKRLPRQEQLQIAHDLKKIKHELNELRVRTMDWHNAQDKVLQRKIMENRDQE